MRGYNLRIEDIFFLSFNQILAFTIKLKWSRKILFLHTYLNILKIMS